MENKKRLNKDIAAIYCRLSKEDLDKDIGKTVSESIKNQKSMLESYANEQQWIIYDFYVDEDYSGSDRNRPEFNRLITDSLLGLFNIVLCKKQARFARDIEYVEKYIHGLFNEKQIRFVAMLDNIDTGSTSRSTRKASQINSLVDEWYLADLSDNIISALTEKRKNAEFIGSWAPYGYKKDPYNKNSLIIDQDAAVIIKNIYNLYLKGMGITAIAQKLNYNCIPNPLTYKNLKGEKINPNPEKLTSKRYLWSPGTISNILHNKVYTGSIVQGKFKKASYKSKKLIRVPKSDWIEIPNCHEAIIDHDTYELVQKNLMAKARTCKGRQGRGILAGKVYCGECGSLLVSSGGSSGERRTTYLCCSKHKISKKDCIGSSIELKKLEHQLLLCINKLSEKYFDTDFILKNIDLKSLEPISINNKIEVEIQSAQTSIDLLDKKIETVYIDKLNGLINEDQFIQFRNRLNQEKELFQTKLIDLELLSFQNSEFINHDGQNSQYDTKTELIKNYKKIEKLTHEMVDELIDSIYIYKRKNNEPQQIEIRWDF